MNTKVAAACAALVVVGAIGSLLAKTLYQLSGLDLQGDPKLFRKPWASTLMMFLGMVIVLPVAVIQSRLQQRRQRSVRLGGVAGETAQPLLSLQPGPDKGAARNTPRRLLLLWFPTLCDLLATLLLSVGLLYVTVSVYQMMRGAEVLFAALLSVLLLSRKLNSWHLAGLATVTAGIALVGIAGAHISSGGPGNEVSADGPPQASSAAVLFGMGIIVFSQAFQASQIVAEDYLLSDLDFHPLMVVGMEGMYGSLAMLGLLLPLVQALPGVDGEGIHENSQDTWHMLMSSVLLRWVAVTNICQLAVYNVVGMVVTDELGAVARTILESLRTLVVWLLDLWLFYGMDNGLGEPWVRPWSWLQAAGFVVLVAGSMLYSRGDEKERGLLCEECEKRGLPPAAIQPLDTVARPRTALHLRSAVLQVITVRRLEQLARQRRAANGNPQHAEA